MNGHAAKENLRSRPLPHSSMVDSSPVRKGLTRAGRTLFSTSFGSPNSRRGHGLRGSGLCDVEKKLRSLFAAFLARHGRLTAAAPSAILTPRADRRV